MLGVLDSPYVRRVAISLDLYGVEFEHQALSVFSTFAEFSRINPVVKAPTMLLDDGTLLIYICHLSRQSLASFLMYHRITNDAGN